MTLAVVLASLVFAPASGQAAYPGSNGLVTTVGTDQQAYAVFGFGPDGSGPRTLWGPFTGITPFNDGNFRRANLSPDATKAAVAGFGGSFGIRVVDLATGIVGPNLTSGLPPPNQTFPHPKWSPDGSTLVFAYDFSSGDNDSISRIWTVPADGSAPADEVLSQFSPGEVTNLKRFIDPTWTVDGQEIVFVKSRFECVGDCTPPIETEAEDSEIVAGNQIRAVGPTGGGERAVSPELNHPFPEFDPAVVENPDVSGDGSTVVFGQFRRQNAVNNAIVEILTVPLAGGAVSTVLTRTGPVNQSHVTTRPVFSPDGTQIAYTDRDQSTGVETLRAVEPNGTNDRFFALSPSDDAFIISPQWLPRGAEPVITGGPSGLVSQRSAAFEFTALGAPPGHFECGFDAQAFATCTSPFTVENLSEAAHTFRVRFKSDNGAPAFPVERTFTVDTTKPAAVIDRAPSGADNGSSGEVAFHSTEPDGATFRCKLDDGAEADCSSPHTLVGLAEGEHIFQVSAFDRAGNRSLPAVARWSVRGGAPPAVTGCPAGSESTGFGPIRLVARAADACFAATTIDGLPAKVSTGVVTMNGIRLTPATGTRIIVSERLGDGTVKTDGPVTVGFGGLTGPQHISGRLASLDLSGLLTATGLANRVLAFAEGSVLAEGFGFAPGASIDFSAENGGQAKVVFRVTLPRAAFRSGPGRGSAEGVTVEFSPTFSNDRGVTVGGRIKLAQVFLFGNKVKDLDLAYDHTTGVFDGSVGIALGEARPGRAEPTLTAAIGMTSGTAACGLAKFALQASNLNKHVGRGAYLQRFGGTFECTGPPAARIVKLAANGGVSLGPRIAVGSFEGEAISVDGLVTFAVPVGPAPPELFSVEATGVGKIVDFPVSSQTVKFKPPATLTVAGKLDLTIGGFGGQFTYGEQGSFVSETGFNIEAAGRANLFFVEASAEAVFSSTGFATCLGPAGRRVGFGRRWGGTLATFESGVCDIGPFRTAVPATAARAAAAHRDSFTVARGRPLTVVAAKGSGRPPKVVVTGPGGQRIRTPAGRGGISNKSMLLFQDTNADTTYVVLFRPAAGRWTVSGARRVRVARGLPPVRLKATVSGKGARRTLTWKGSGLAGQRIQFTERAGNTSRPIATTGKSSGKLRFTPDPRLGAARTIEAVVSNRGLPRETRTVTRYRIAPPATPKRVAGLKLAKNVLTWRALAGATTYEIALTRPDGTTTSHTARRARFSIPGLPARGALRVQIFAVNALGRSGPATTATFQLR